MQSDVLLNQKIKQMLSSCSDAVHILWCLTTKETLIVFIKKSMTYS